MGSAVAQRNEQWTAAAAMAEAVEQLKAPDTKAEEAAEEIVKNRARKKVSGRKDSRRCWGGEIGKGYSRLQLTEDFEKDI